MRNLIYRPQSPTHLSGGEKKDLLPRGALSFPVPNQDPHFTRESTGNDKAPLAVCNSRDSSQPLKAMPANTLGAKKLGPMVNLGFTRHGNATMFLCKLKAVLDFK